MESLGRFKMSTVCERTGFNQSILRAWERRYGLLEPARTPGGHRLYTEDDIRVLERVRGLIEQGRSIGEIASLGRGSLLGDAGSEWAGFGDLRDDVARHGFHPPHCDHDSLRVQSLSEAALELDERALEAELDRAFATYSAATAIDRVLLPALVRIGEIWADGGCSVACEHLLSSRVVARMLNLLRVANPKADANSHVLCACLPNEGHEIGALYCSLHFAGRGARVTYLGARLPFDGLVAAATRLRPRRVCLSTATNDGFAEQRAGLLNVASRLPEATDVYIGGRGVRAPDPELQAVGIKLIAPTESPFAALGA